MNTQRIYIQLLDGTTAWVPMESEKISENRFKILEDDGYLDLDEFPLHLFEFWPGDIIAVKPHTFLDGSVGQVASELIKPGNWPERKFAEFKFKATLGQLVISEETTSNFRREIDRVKQEYANGQFFYPAILETIRTLERLK